MIPGYTRFNFDPPATPATLLPFGGKECMNTDKAYRNGSNGSNGSKVAATQKQNDEGTIVERAAIMEYDGDLDRDRANLRAAKLYDDSRQRLQGDPSTAAMLYREYILDWKPETENDLPACPPNFAGNVGLWRAWWSKVETRHV